MTGADLEQSITELAAIPTGSVGICAETIDGRHLIEINADEIYPAASRGGEGLAEALFEDVREYGTRVCTIRPGWLNTPLVAANEGTEPALMIQPEDISRTVLFVPSMAETACPTEITILPQRSPYV